MGDIDTNLFGEKPVETDAAEIEKAKKEIASKGSVLLTVAPQMPSPEDIGRSRSLANRAMREAESLVVKDLESYKTGCDLSLACAQAIKAIEKPEAGSKMAEVQRQKDNAHSLHKFFTGLISFALVETIVRAGAIVLRFQRDVSPQPVNDGPDVR